MADDWFDGGSPPHLAANGFGDAPNLAADPDAELLFVIVAAITLVDMDAASLNAGLLLQLGDHRPQRVAVERIAMQGFGVQHKLADFWLRRRGGDRYPCLRRGRLLQPNSYGARALPLPMHSTSGACSA